MQELDLEKIRQEIDKVDQQLADVLESRLQLVMQVAAYKKSKGLPVKDKNREAKVIEKVAGFLENKEYSVAVKNIMIVGVGGQGTLLTSRILGGLTIAGGYDVKLSEVHGMAQRGGSVVTFVRYGEKVAEPIVEEGQADVIIAFERLEALRYAHFLKKDGVLI
uniref:chorismate mutase n=1 Tax=Phascolarctobacterium succinatutens TaxID=626940 RepID=UPI0026F0E1D2